jgi:hypothetical protein
MGANGVVSSAIPKKEIQRIAKAQGRGRLGIPQNSPIGWRRAWTLTGRRAVGIK